MQRQLIGGRGGLVKGEEKKKLGEEVTLKGPDAKAIDRREGW